MSASSSSAVNIPKQSFNDITDVFKSVKTNQLTITTIGKFVQENSTTMVIKSLHFYLATMKFICKAAMAGVDDLVFPNEAIANQSKLYNDDYNAKVAAFQLERRKGQQCDMVALRQLAKEMSSSENFAKPAVKALMNDIKGLDKVLLHQTWGLIHKSAGTWESARELSKFTSQENKALHMTLAVEMYVSILPAIVSSWIYRSSPLSLGMRTFASGRQSLRDGELLNYVAMSPLLINILGEQNLTRFIEQDGCNIFSLFQSEEFQGTAESTWAVTICSGYQTFTPRWADRVPISPTFNADTFVSLLTHLAKTQTRVLNALRTNDVQKLFGNFKSAATVKTTFAQAVKVSAAQQLPANSPQTGTVISSVLKAQPSVQPPAIEPVDQAPTLVDFSSTNQNPLVVPGLMSLPDEELAPGHLQKLIQEGKVIIDKPKNAPKVKTEHKLAIKTGFKDQENINKIIAHGKKQGIWEDRIMIFIQDIESACANNAPKIPIALLLAFEEAKYIEVAELFFEEPSRARTVISDLSSKYHELMKAKTDNIAKLQKTMLATKQNKDSSEDEKENLVLSALENLRKEKADLAEGLAGIAWEFIDCLVVDEQ